MAGRANQPDDDHDSTEVPWSQPYIAARLDERLNLGYDWPVGKSITLTVEDLATPQLVDYTDEQVMQPAEP